VKILRAFSGYLATTPARQRYSFDMPGQRRTVGGRSRGSWLARLAGISVIVVLAGGAVTGYLVTMHPLGAHATTLSSHVVSAQTVGLVAENAQSGSSGQVVQLLGRRGTPRFSPVSQAEQQSGSGQWTADLMSGGSYIFIFLPSDTCLGSAGSTTGTRLVLQHCDLQASQRWRRLGSATLAQGHSFYRYANMAEQSCLTEGGELRGSVWAAGLSRCTTATATGQLVAFWWAAG
jgi:hypothetical protein